MINRTRWEIRQARNLTGTMGPWRALHVAKQFGWQGVASEITAQNRDRTQTRKGRMHSDRWAWHD